jgi:hypothetical protein
LFFTGYAAVWAGDMPNLIGEWQSVGKGAVVSGHLTHRPKAEKTKISHGVTFTLRITNQDGPHFYGERFSSKAKEKDSLKAIYMEPGKKSKVVSIGDYTRVKK